MDAGFVRAPVGKRQSLRMELCPSPGQAMVRGVAGAAVALTVGFSTGVRAEREELPVQLPMARVGDIQILAAQEEDMCEGWARNSMYKGLGAVHTPDEFNWMHFRGDEMDFSVVPLRQPVLHRTFAAHFASSGKAAKKHRAKTYTAISLPEPTAKEQFLCYVQQHQRSLLRMAFMGISSSCSSDRKVKHPQATPSALMT